MNHPNNRYFIEVVAGRSANAYTQYHQKNVTDSLVCDDNKYTALRTNKAATVEFRIFRGTVNYKHIIRNLEFCDALCDYCAPCETSLKELADFRHFIKWVEERRYSYPVLADWLGTIDLVAKRKVKKEGEVLEVEVVNEEIAHQLSVMTEISKSGESIEQAVEAGKLKVKAPVKPPKKPSLVDWVEEEPSTSIDGVEV